MNSKKHILLLLGLATSCVAVGATLNANLGAAELQVALSNQLSHGTQAAPPHKDLNVIQIDIEALEESDHVLIHQFGSPISYKIPSSDYVGLILENKLSN